MDKVAYWLDLADYDMETAKAMADTRRWLYVGFMCHQVVEKTLKAYWCGTKEEEAPYTHNLLNLVQSTTLAQMLTNEQRQFVQQIMPLNIEARYPDYKERLLQWLTPERCAELLTQTEQFQLWIKTRLSK